MNSSPKHWLIKSVSSLKGANLPSTIASLLHRRQRQLNRTFNISPPLCSRREHGMFQDFDRTHYVDSGSKHNGLFTPHLVCGSPHPSILTLDHRDTRGLLETPSGKRSEHWSTFNTIEQSGFQIPFMSESWALKSLHGVSEAPDPKVLCCALQKAFDVQIHPDYCNATDTTARGTHHLIYCTGI